MAVESTTVATETPEDTQANYLSTDEKVAEIYRMVKDIHSAVMPVIPALAAAKAELDTKGIAGLMRAIMMPGLR